MGKSIGLPKASREQWYQITRAEASPSADIYLYDVIDPWFGVSSKEFVDELAALDVAEINLYINSPGGSVYDAVAMLNALRRHPARITAHVDSLAASAASFIAMAGDEVVMGRNSELMIHDAWGICIGSSQDMHTHGDRLDQISDNIASIYAEKAGGEAAAWRDIMRAETWYSADEAVAAGLADRVTEKAATEDDPANVFDLSIFAHAGRRHAPAPPIAATMTTPRTDHPTNTQEEPEMGDSTATVQAGTLAARRAGTGTPTTNRKTTTKADLFNILAGAQGNPREVFNVLSDIVPGDVLGIEQPQYVGELWDGKAYERRIIPLFNHAELTSFKVKGWRWVTKPTVGKYGGNKAQIPSAKIKTAPVEISASRLAGGHDIDRKFRDFNDTEFFAAYFAAMTESYARVSDNEVLTEVLDGATDVVRGEVPTDVPAGLVSVVDGALNVLNETDTAPSFAIVATDLWREILLTPKDKTLEYLSSGLGLESGDLSGFRLLPSSALGAGEVLTGVRSAVTVHELGGPAPIRVEALDIAKGGIDEAVFGYYAVNIHDAGGLAHVLPTEPAAG